MLRMQGFNYIKVNFLSFEMNHLNKKQFEFVISTLTLTQITVNKTIWIERKRRRRTKPITKGRNKLIMIGLSFRCCFRVRQADPHWIVNNGVMSGVGRR